MGRAKAEIQQLAIIKMDKKKCLREEKNAFIKKLFSYCHL